MRKRSSGEKLQTDIYKQEYKSSLNWTQWTEYAEWVGVFGLIFGGCCSNVLTLESIVTKCPNSGQLITFVQFLFVSIEGFIYFFDPTLSSWKRLYLCSPHIPLHQWIVPVGLFFAVSVLNNYVWVCNISVPIHIIIRSGGTVATMAVGVVVGKRYTTRQIIAVILLTVGVIMATLSQNKPKKGSMNVKDNSIVGVSMLIGAAVLGAIQGLVTEKTYQKYGRHWRENLFYTHFMSLVLFVPLHGQIRQQFID